MKTFSDYMQEKWQEVNSATSEVDLTFLILRLLSLAGGMFWLMAVPLSPEQQTTLTNALILFSLYSLACYCIIFMEPSWLRGVYLASLFLDLVFLSYMVNIEPQLENSFFIGYYLLVCLHTIYFGLRFGLAVATFSAFLYFAGIFHHISQYAWTELALRIAFLYLIAVPVGMLSKKVKRDKTIVEGLNNELAQSLQNLREAQEKLIEAEKFSALGRLTAYITHEIRNPLTAVGGFARRLEKRLTDGSSEKEYVSVIIHEVSRLEKILLDTLIYGRAQDFQFDRNDINVPVNATAELYQDLCQEQYITLTQRTPSDLPRGKIDTEQVQQALDSLISNSIQAMPRGGFLSLRTGKEIRYKTTFLIIQVNDTGGGIDPDTLDYVFEPFYSTKKIGLGTGLGLPIVKKIMTEHRGRIEIDNRPGQGTGITLFFPFQSEEQDQMVPCWEYLKCGIETDPTRRCAAYPNFGRICWSTAGSFCPKNTEGICAQKLENCEDCAFYKMVNEHLPVYVSPS
ncbi:MAG: ATP-binding protein [Desulfobulbaceae bacterium]|nr:ATP-binding protein [Desulfobulbaceae bacterium]